MKYLSDYVQGKQTALFEETGAFFAFSKDQLDEQTVKGTKYYSLGSGMFCPQDTTERLETGLTSIHEQGIAQDLAENGKVAIIWREFANHEVQIGGDITDVVDIMKDYGIDEADVVGEYGGYFKHCVELDLF